MGVSRGNRGTNGEDVGTSRHRTRVSAAPPGAEAALAAGLTRGPQSFMWARTGTATARPLAAPEAPDNVPNARVPVCDAGLTAPGLRVGRVPRTPCAPWLHALGRLSPSNAVLLLAIGDFETEMHPLSAAPSCTKFAPPLPAV